MVALEEVRQLVSEILQLGERGNSLNADSALLGEIPEFDSMAVVAVLTSIEEQYGLVIDDDDVSAEDFETLGSLHQFISQRAV